MFIAPELHVNDVYEARGKHLIWPRDINEKNRRRYPSHEIKRKYGIEILQLREYLS